MVAVDTVERMTSDGRSSQGLWPV